jgi:hypothetical protein
MADHMGTEVQNGRKVKIQSFSPGLPGTLNALPSRKVHLPCRARPQENGEAIAPVQILAFPIPLPHLAPASTAEPHQFHFGNQSIRLLRTLFLFCAFLGVFLPIALSFEDRMLVILPICAIRCCSGGVLGVPVLGFWWFGVLGFWQRLYDKLVSCAKLGM